MKETPKFFVGFGQLEALLASHEKHLPLYCLLDVNLTPHRAHLQSCIFSLVISDVQDGVARMWRRPVGRLTDMGGDLVKYAQEVKRTRERAQQAYVLVADDLVFRQKFIVHNGMVAMPPSIHIAEGHTDLFHYDTASDSFKAGPVLTLP